MGRSTLDSGVIKESIDSSKKCLVCKLYFGIFNSCTIFLSCIYVVFIYVFVDKL